MNGKDPQTEQAVDEFLDGQLRAAEWRAFREALAARLKDAVAERDGIPEDDPARAALEARIAELREQVRVLAEEEAITGFVEESVRASLTRPAPPPRWDDDPDDEGYY